MKTSMLFGLLIAVGFIYVGFFRKAKIEVPAGNNVTIQLNADSIKEICEMAGAEQRVTVLFDTTFVVQNPDIVIWGMQFLKRDKKQRYAEQRVWQIKAGTPGLHIETETGKQVLCLSYPKILTSQELDTEFKILHNTTDNWSPVLVHQHVARSRRLAEAKAIRNGIAARAAVSIEEALRNILPNQVKIKWEEKP